MRSKTMLKVPGLILVALVASVNASNHGGRHTYITIDANTTNCGETFDVLVDQEFMVQGTGDSPGVDCSYLFRGEVNDNCNGLCYNMKAGSFFRDENVTLTVVSGSKTVDYHTNKINRDNPMCSEGTSLSVSLTTPLDYAPNAKKEGFGFTMEVYNWCKEPGNSDGNGNSITFDEAIKHLENFHHGEKFDDMVRMNMIHGLLVGFGLASIFLIVLCAACCYVKNSPNRGRKSASMNISKPKESGNKPENVMLLTMSSDPEKPPVGGATKR